MKIKSIKVGKRDKAKLILYLEDGSFVETAADESFSLRVGDDISAEDAARLSDGYASKRVRDSAARSLSHRAMSKSELKKKLCSRGFSEEESEDAASRFEELGLINDEKYAESVAKYYKSRGYGSRKIREEMFRRGISREIGEAAEKKLPEGDGELCAFIAKKLKGKAPDKDEKRKLTAALMRRGFSYGEIRAAFSKMEFDISDMEAE